MGSVKRHRQLLEAVDAAASFHNLGNDGLAFEYLEIASGLAAGLEELPVDARWYEKGVWGMVGYVTDLVTKTVLWLLAALLGGITASQVLMDSGVL